MEQNTYYLERYFFPESLFSVNFEQLLSSITTEKGEFCVGILKWINRAIHDYNCPYSADQFKPHVYKVKSGIDTVPYFYMLQLSMPEPDVSPLCKRVYFCHDEAYSNRYYFTVEKGVKHGWVLGEWKDNGIHVNHGECPADLEGELQRIEDLYIDYCQNGDMDIITMLRDSRDKSTETQ